MSESLFRPEVLNAQATQAMGEVRLAQPISSYVIAFVTALIVGMLVLFVCLGEITRKSRITGVTVPTAGSVAIVAPVSGVLKHVFVREGEAVVAGQSILTLSTERQSSTGGLSFLIGQQLASRRDSLLAESRLRSTQADEKRQALTARAASVRLELQQLDQELALAQRRHALAQRNLAKFELLQESGYVSIVQAQQRHEELLEWESRLLILKRDRIQTEANLSALTSEIQLIASNLVADKNQIERALASLAQETAENGASESRQVLAPHAGAFTGLTNKVGQFVNAGQVLATLLSSQCDRNKQTEVFECRGTSPDMPTLEVHLYAPSKTIGFVRAGQHVKIRYQAFPYQKFGLYAGKVIDVSMTPFSPAELPAQIAGTISANAQAISGSGGTESLYRIRVKPALQHIPAYGTNFPIKPGMTLEADIVNDTRRIWEWILEPIVAIGRRFA